MEVGGDSIKMDVREVVCETGIWMELAQDSMQCRDLVLAVLILDVAVVSAGNFL